MIEGQDLNQELAQLLGYPTNGPQPAFHSDGVAMLLLIDLMRRRGQLCRTATLQTRGGHQYRASFWPDPDPNVAFSRTSLPDAVARSAYLQLRREANLTKRG